MSIEKVRKFLKGVDDGILTESEAEMRILDALLTPYLDRVETTGKDTGIAGSWCGDEPPPAKRAVVEVGPGNRVWFYPVVSVMPGGS